MQNQRGFVGVGVLIAIILAVVVLGGGAYYVVQQQTPTQTASDNFDNVQTLPTTNNQQTQTTAKTPPQTTPIQNPTPISQSGTFTVPSTFTINKGQTIAQAGVNNGVTIKYKEYMSNPYERVLPGQEYCVSSTLSYVGSVATEFGAKGITIVADGENRFTSCNPNMASDPVLYNGLKISVTNFTSNSATYKAEFAPDSAQATINQSSLSSNTSSPIISGTATNLKHVTVYIFKDPKSIDPATIKIGDGVKSVGPIATTPGIIGYVDVISGTWSTSFIQYDKDSSGKYVKLSDGSISTSPANLPDGTYKVNVAHPYSRYSLTTGTLTISSGVAVSVPGTIKITSPTSGEKFSICQTYPIQWEGGPSASTYAYMNTVDSGGVEMIVKNTLKRQDTWTLGNSAGCNGGGTINPGQYKIRIKIPKIQCVPSEWIGVGEGDTNVRSCSANDMWVAESGWFTVVQ